MSTRVRRILGSGFVGTLALLLLAGSAVTGNVFQGVGNADLKGQLNDANAKVAQLERQLSLVKDQQECRSQIASESELQSGRLQAAVGKLIVANQHGDRDTAQVAIEEIADSTAKLVPALDRRLHAVDLCSANPNADTSTTTTTTTSTTTVPSTTPKAVRRTTTTGRTTTTTGTTTTVYRSSPTTVPTPRTCSIPIPLELPCL